MVVACCDSRSAPETIFNAAPGEIFVVRNVANLVPPYEPDGSLDGTSAALEFAVQSLRVRHIVVLGHGRCGGIRAALHPAAEPLSPGDFIGKWMKPLGPAAAEVAANAGLTDEERQTALERASDPPFAGEPADLPVRLDPGGPRPAQPARRLVRHRPRRALDHGPRHRRVREGGIGREPSRPRKRLPPLAFRPRQSLEPGVRMLDRVVAGARVGGQNTG